MTNWKTAAVTVGLTLLALFVWDAFLRDFATGLLKKRDEAPAGE